jgi:hypothetical protein
MTILASPAQVPSDVRPASPSLARLVAAGLVATMAVIVFSIAIGNQVIGSSRMIVPAQGDVALQLVASTPLLVFIGLLHVAVAFALAHGRDGLRIVAVLASGLTSLAAASSAAMLAAGVDPFALSGGGQISTGAIGLLVIAAVVYGTAAVVGGSGPVED